MRPRILFLVPSDYASMEQKGVLHMIYDRDEQGFFERVVTIHPLAFKDRVIELSPVHVIYEFGLKNSLQSYIGLFLLPFRLVLFLSKLLRIVKNENIHIIRATDAYLMGLLAWLISKLTGLPFCISIHADYEKSFALDPSQGIRRLLRTFSKWCPAFIYRRAGIIMPISNYLLNRISPSILDSERVRVIPHGIDFSFMKKEIKNDLHKLFYIDKTIKIISYVARLSKEKYPYDVLAVAKKMYTHRNDFIIIMAGGGPEEVYLKKMLESDVILNSTIRLVGFKSRDVVLDLRRTATVNLCLLEGFSLIEACASGKPVVAYDVEWHSELIIDGTTGFLVKEHDIDGLVGAVSYLLDNPDEAKRMGENAKRFAFEKHDLSKTSEIKKAAYRELLSRNKKYYHETA